MKCAGHGVNLTGEIVEKKTIKSPMSPNDGNHIAEGKGVGSDPESEGS